MTPIEKLVEHYKRYFLGRDSCLCPDCTGYLRMLIEEYESALEPWMPPLPIAVPDWEDIWLVIEFDGSGWFCQSSPSILFINDSWSGHEQFAGFFQIPPETDWRTLKFRVRKDGVLV